jgi:hypothetical protein
MLPLAEWQTFLSVQAECAATLTGLVFVAVSINLAQILSGSGLTGRAAESLAQFLQVFFISGAALIPRQSPAALAVEIIAITILGFALQLISQVRYARSRSGHPKWWLVSRIVQTHLGSVPLFIAAICLIAESPAAFYWLVPGFLFSFFSGILNAWILLIEINR